MSLWNGLNSRKNGGEAPGSGPVWIKPASVRLHVPTNQRTTPVFWAQATLAEQPEANVSRRQGQKKYVADPKYGAILIKDMWLLGIFCEMKGRLFTQIMLMCSQSANKEPHCRMSSSVSEIGPRPDAEPTPKSAHSLNRRVTVNRWLLSAKQICIFFIQL